MSKAKEWVEGAYLKALAVLFVVALYALLTMPSAHAQVENTVKVSTSHHTTARADYIVCSRHKHTFGAGAYGLIRAGDCPGDLTLAEIQAAPTSAPYSQRSDTAMVWAPCVNDPRDNGNRCEPISRLNLYYDLDRLSQMPQIGEHSIGRYENGDVRFACGSGNGANLTEAPIGCDARDWRITTQFPGMNVRTAIHYEQSDGKLRSLRVSCDDEDGWCSWREVHADYSATFQPQFVTDIIEPCARQYPNFAPYCRTEKEDMRYFDVLNP